MTGSPVARSLGLETKYLAFQETPTLSDGGLEGYASVFDIADDSGDTVAPGAFADSLARRGRGIKLLWQHDPERPIGVWDALREDSCGLFARGRLLTGIQAGAEAATLLRAGAVDGLSIGYRAIRSARLPGGGRRLLEIDLWEISLVTFPMLSEARAAAAQTASEPDAAISELLRDARALFS